MPRTPRAVIIGWSFALQLACPLWGGPGDDDRLFAEIDAFVEQERVDSRIPGIAVAIVNGTQIVHARGYGEDGNGYPITPATPFPIGSNTKSFTSLAAMQLVEAAKVELDAPVQRYLPDFRLADAATSSRITVRQLLNQTSGLSRHSGLRPLFRETQESLEQAVAGMRNVELNRSPGDSFEYSNLNAVILGRIIERVSGVSWARYIQDKILIPLNMTNTYTSFEEAARMSGVHRYAFGFPFKTEPVYLPGMAPAGYLASSAQDMARYLSFYLSPAATLERKPLSSTGIAAMLTPETNTIVGPNLTYRYGRGWAVGPLGVARDARWHSGALDSFNAWMVQLPETQQGVVVLMNAGSYFPVHQANGVFRRIPIGVVNILRGAQPPSGITIKRFFALFDVAVLALLLGQLALIRRVAARGRDSWTLCGVDVGLGAAGLIGWPAISGMSWHASLRALPDLAIVVAVVSLLFLVQAGVRFRCRTAQASLGI